MELKPVYLFIVAFLVIVIGIAVLQQSAANIEQTDLYSNSSSNDSLYLTSSQTLSPVGDGITSSSAQVYNQTWLNFDGVNDKVSVVPTSIMSNSTITYFAYLYFNSSFNGSRDFLSWQDTIFRRTNIGLSWYPNTSAGSSNFVYNINDSNIFVAITQEGTTCRFNINDIYNDTFSCTQGLRHNNFSSGLGSYGSLNYFGGKIYFAGFISRGLGLESLHDIYYNRDNFTGLNQGIPILGMHNVGDVNTTYYTNISEFTKYMDYLHNNNFNTITFSQFTNYTKGLYTLPINPVIISFDDGTDNIYDNAYPIMKARGFVGCVNVIASTINTTGKMNWTELQEMLNDGWEVASHGETHCNFVTNCNTTAQWISEFNLSKWNIDHNLTDVNGNMYNTTSLIYPYTSFNSTINDLAKNYFQFTGGYDRYIEYFSLGYNYGYKNTPLYGRFERLAIANTTSYYNFTSALYNVLYPNANNTAIFKLNENSGTTAYDSSGNGNNGTISGATWQNDGVLVSLINSVDYTLNTITGVFTILNSEHLYSYIISSWDYNYRTNDRNVNVARIIEIFLAISILVFIVLIINYYVKEFK